ncbi:MAG TPA: pyridoxamine kinase [Bacteroidetes bacterium]|nr:pyridoxamine kinase [Bacteroidota bacterium]
MMKSPVKRVAAIHDLSGIGHVSLTAVIPILSAMGIQVCPLPTAVLSAHSRYQAFHFVDLTDHVPAFIDHWKRLGISFHAIYSGFLGSHRQIRMVEEMIAAFRHEELLVAVDPVMGDDGKLYGPMKPEMVNEMRQLIGRADLITPNLTEAAFLLGKEPPAQIGIQELKDWIRKLSEMGPGMVVVTSVPDQDSGKRTSVIAYNRQDKRFWRVSCDYLPADYPGTGDCFASVLVGSLLQGDSLPVALDRAVHFISSGVRTTFGYNYDPNEGIMLERILNTLNMPVNNGSYQILD